MKILLTTLHAKYSHASLALPCLAAYCSDISGALITIREYTVNEPREHTMRLIMAEEVDLIGFSCYIWNIEMTLKLVSDIKKIAPKTKIVLGGPEVSFGIFDLMHDNPFIDFVIKGEGEKSFRGLIESLLNEPSCLLQESLGEIDNIFFRDGKDTASGPLNRKNMELNTLPSPFQSGFVDFSKPLIYYETSRGCPFSCAFCLSSTEGSVRSFGMERIKKDLHFLMNQQVGQIKLVDRTFNYDARRADEIWEFILEHNISSHFHFEIAADLLTANNLNTLSKVPDNTFRFEIGIQSSSEKTLNQVGRKSDLERIFANVRSLKAGTKIDIHLDLVAGLPGEDYVGFLKSLQVVAELKPDMLQLEPLKLLKGTEMRAIATREDYKWSEAPPYTILHNRWLSYKEICRIETIGRLLDLFGKHGGCKAAFQVLERHKPYSTVLDEMATLAGNENLSSLSCRRVFELFARLAGDIPDSTTREELHDALFFDYCRSEMPVADKLPSFAKVRQKECLWLRAKDLALEKKSLEEQNIPEGSRVKAFRYTFMGDYRSENSAPKSFTATFVYISAAGRSLQIVVIP